MFVFRTVLQRTGMAKQISIETVFTKAIKVPNGREREKWIAKNCDTNLELELRRLIAAHEGVGTFLSKSAMEIENKKNKDK